MEFDSVFNRSKHTVAFGSPDIVPIFCSTLSNSYSDSYSTEFEDFATGNVLLKLLILQLIFVLC